MEFWKKIEKKKILIKKKVLILWVYILCLVNTGKAKTNRPQTVNEKCTLMSF